jgi:hypothetical protein
MDKSIKITGINNRYYIKKLTKENKVEIRVNSKKWQIDRDILEWDNQLKNIDNEEYPLFQSEIKTKLNSYKSQDQKKNIYDTNLFITYEDLIEKIKESKLKCYYCCDSIFILYEIVRENKQWTLDRINNDEGHNKNNIVISCLQCNLKRRDTNSNKFLFTKQLILNKVN